MLVTCISSCSYFSSSSSYFLSCLVIFHFHVPLLLSLAFLVSLSIFHSSFVCCFLISSFELHYLQIPSSNLPFFNINFSCCPVLFICFLSLFLVCCFKENHFCVQVRGCFKRFLRAPVFKNLKVSVFWLRILPFF